ncbi:hypothetical protein DXX92_07450 [Thalassotalea euphylliae]|uniref:Uncharacterized protein n=2 Tax=Thalassotalea euphylliae TaxID=1655234 RepID=A0A3E0UF70_9GAMM|nr:hypothetical protein DXX92_07450 [Thalassotalea euphylliae]
MMTMKSIVFLILALITLPAVALDVVNYSSHGRDNLPYDKYYRELLALALNKSSPRFGPYQLNGVDAGKTQTNMIELIKHRHIVNVAWTMTSKARERELLPIRVPLFKGLGGCRIFLIRQGEQDRFSQITKVSDLQNLLAGQGADWPDTSILKANNFNVITAKQHNSLFSMLTKQRFDYFPRALHEAYSEAARFPELTVEQSSLLYYPAPFFFFVSKEDKRLAERIEYGLNRMMADGSFEQFFNQNPYSKSVRAKANINNRRIYTLKNPLLTAQTAQVINSKQYQTSCRQFQ